MKKKTEWQIWLGYTERRQLRERKARRKLKEEHQTPENIRRERTSLGMLIRILVSREEERTEKREATTSNKKEMTSTRRKMERRRSTKSSWTMRRERKNR